MRQYRALARVGAPDGRRGRGRPDRRRRPADAARRGPARDRRARPRGAAAGRMGAAELRGGRHGAGHPGGHCAFATAPGAQEDTRGARRRPGAPTDDRPPDPPRHLEPAGPAHPRRPRRGPSGSAPARCAQAAAAARWSRRWRPPVSPSPSSRPSAGATRRSRSPPPRCSSAPRPPPSKAVYGSARHQWIYLEDRLTASADQVAARRRRRDGLDRERQLASRDHARRTAARPAREVLFDGYRELAALPTDPDALLRWAYGEAKTITGAGLTEHGDVYAIFNGMLRGNVLPPDLEAAIFRALKQVPGVELTTRSRSRAARRTAWARPRTGWTRSCCSTARPTRTSASARRSSATPPSTRSRPTTRPARCGGVTRWSRSGSRPRSSTSPASAPVTQVCATTSTTVSSASPTPPAT